MTDLRTAAQQALEALEAIREADTAGATPKMVVEARKMYEPTITALRAALVEPDVPETDFGNMAVAVAEPVASVTECEACFTPDVCQLRGTCDHYAAERLRVAAPPQRKPLLAVDLRALYDQHAACQEEGPETSGWWDFARAIERAHEIT